MALISNMSCEECCPTVCGIWKIGQTGGGKWDRQRFLVAPAESYVTDPWNQTVSATVASAQNQAGDFDFSDCGCGDILGGHTLEPFLLFPGPYGNKLDDFTPSKCDFWTNHVKDGSIVIAAGDCPDQRPPAAVDLTKKWRISSTFQNDGWSVIASIDGLLDVVPPIKHLPACFGTTSGSCNRSTGQFDVTKGKAGLDVDVTF